MSTYIYDAGWERERERLAGLEAVSDPATLESFDRIGVGPGWRCLEVGGGGGSIAQHLSERVAPDGHVVAVDLDTRFLEAIDADNLEVHRLDITTDAIPGGPFDLIHTRAVLEHLPSRDEVLGQLIGLLAPAGWLVVEDVDFQLAIRGEESEVPAASPEVAVLQAKWWRAAATMMRHQGIDLEYGRRLPTRLREGGLDEVGATSRAHVFGPDEPGAVIARLSVLHFRAPLIEQGLLTEEEVDEVLALLDEPAAGWGPAMVTAWGRRAADRA